MSGHPEILNSKQGEKVQPLELVESAVMLYFPWKGEGPTEKAQGVKKDDQVRVGRIPEERSTPKIEFDPGTQGSFLYMYRLKKRKLQA